jgi:hypothetical protein
MPSSDPVAGWKPHGPNCFCSRCASRRRRREHQPVVRVEAADVSAHIAALKADGWTQQRIAEAAGLSAGVVSKARHPDSVLDQATAESILALH